MRVIDANSGHEVHELHPFRNVDGVWLPVLIKPGLFRASIRMLGPWASWQDYYTFMEASKPLDYSMVPERPLQVRWTHPGFFLRHVAFIPS